MLETPTRVKKNEVFHVLGVDVVCVRAEEQSLEVTILFGKCVLGAGANDTNAI